jgi:hypothetical protein
MQCLVGAIGKAPSEFELEEFIQLRLHQERQRTQQALELFKARVSKEPKRTKRKAKRSSDSRVMDEIREAAISIDDLVAFAQKRKEEKNDE